MIFGSTTAIHHMLPRPTLDVQWIPAGIADPLPEMRWFDRVVYEENLITTWQGLVAKYHQYEPRPFRGIDPHTLMREDTPAGYRVFREAAINLLTHQDYAGHTRKAVIKFCQDVIQLWNPGDVFGSDEHLMEPGEKEVRNPRIVVAFRRLALCEQAGTGMRMMKTQWQTLSHPEPGYTNDRSRKAFEFCLPLKTESKTGQVAGEVTGEVRRLLTCFRGEMTRRELQNALQLRGEENFRQKYLMPALAGGGEMTVPDKPKSRLQKYRLTEKGKQWLAAIIKAGSRRNLQGRS
jgi:ATP-dependent DNA helicase RecG